MRRSGNFKILGRAVGVVAAVAILASGVTFAALQSQQNVLTGNTIETATANLQLSTDGINYSNSQAGFDFNNIVPGGPALPTTGYAFFLKNSGGAALALKMSLASTPSNPDNVDLSKVNVLLTTIGDTGGPQSFTLQALLNNGGVAIGNEVSNYNSEYKLQVSMSSDAVTGNSASLGNIDFALSGTAVSN